MDITVIGVPIYYGCDNKGVERGADYLREAGIIEILESHGHNVADLGNIEVANVSSQEKFAGHDKIKFLNPVFEASCKLSQAVSNTVSEGKFPLIIGGDHSCGIGIISGIVNATKGETAIIWIDAHSDIHSFDTSPSGNIHGVPLGASIGLECGNFNGLFNKYIKGENIFIVGLRSYEKQEIDIMTRFGVNYYSVSDIREKGMDKILNDVTNKLKHNGIENVHLSFDIDSLDPSIAPGTGLHVLKGLNETEVRETIKGILTTGLVKSMDIAEFNPLYDRGNKTSELILRVVGLL